MSKPTVDKARIAKLAAESKKSLDALNEMVKSVKGSERPGHKYIKREPGARGYKYVYTMRGSKSKPDGKDEHQANLGHNDLIKDAVARWILARKDGDVAGAKAIKTRLDRYMKKHNFSPAAYFMHFGNPDDPKQADKVHAAAEKHLQSVTGARLDKLVDLIS